jgi:hypothetical protein
MGDSAVRSRLRSIRYASIVVKYIFNVIEDAIYSFFGDRYNNIVSIGDNKKIIYSCYVASAKHQRSA